MNNPSRMLLPLLIAAAVSGGAQAADKECVELQSAPPGLYATTDEGKTFLIKGDQILEMEAGEAAFADKDRLICIKRTPRFLDWPCSTEAARSRKFATYAIEDLETSNQPKEIVQRYFEIPEVIEPIPDYVGGEYHIAVDMKDIIQFASEEYWYHPDKSKPVVSGKRPHTQLISLYVGINQVVLDSYTLDGMRDIYGSDPIPVVFKFNDSNVVPVSYFGPNVSMEEIFKAFVERDIKLADVPMWELGDYHLAPTVSEFEKYFEIPELEDIDDRRRTALQADLEINGFSNKPVFVTIIQDAAFMLVDYPARIRIAESLGHTHIPTVIVFIEPDAHLQRCGPGTPAGSGEVSGATTPIGGATVPPGAPVVPPPPGNDSDS